MTVVLAIAVLLLAAGLIYVLVVGRQEEVQVEPDLGPAIQQATAEVASQMMSNLLAANDEARKVDARTAEAALDKRQGEIDKRQAEMKALTDRIGPRPRENRGRSPQARRNRPPDPDPARADGPNRRQPQFRDRRPEEGAAPATDPRPVG